MASSLEQRAEQLAEGVRNGRLSQRAMGHSPFAFWGLSAQTLSSWAGRGREMQPDQTPCLCPASLGPFSLLFSNKVVFLQVPILLS